MSSTLEPGAQFGRYQVTRFLAHGGMGSVYEAMDTELARPVAIKILIPHLSEDPDFRRRFEAEARTLASLDSPHVVKLFEHGSIDGRLYFVTQLVRGRDLAQLLKDEGALSPSQAIELTLQLCSGLADAHEAGLVHRDVKPSNVLVQETAGGDLFAYLIDFGIARRQDGDHTGITHGVIGTLAYLAPERHEGQVATVATDIYAVGCLLWALLSGQAPFADRSGVHIALAHMHEPPLQFADASPQGRLNGVLRRCLAKNPSDRYASCRELRDDLKRVLRTVDQEAAPHQGDTTHVTPRAAPGLPPPHLVGTQVPGATPDGGTQEVRPGRGRGWLAVAATVAAVALIAVGFAAVAMFGPGEPDPPAAGSDNEVATSQPGTPTDPASSSAVPPTRTPATARSEPQVDIAALKGAEGMARVFPSARGCTYKGRGRGGKLEVYECTTSRWVLRYSRWRADVARVDYFNLENGVRSQPWVVAGEEVGLQWISVEDSPDEPQPFQFSATYDDLPFSVSAEGVTPQDRADALRTLRITPLAELPTTGG